MLPYTQSDSTSRVGVMTGMMTDETIAIYLFDGSEGRHPRIGVLTLGVEPVLRPTQLPGRRGAVGV